MTSRRYPESKPLSRPWRARRPFRIPDHYEAARPLPAGDDHPVDLLIESLPGMAQRRRNLIRLRQAIQRQVRCQLDFIKYEDARTDLATRREHTYYNLGYQRGHWAGMAESSTCTGAADPAVSAFQRQICQAIATVRIPTHKIAAALMDIARASVMTLSPNPRRPPRP